MLQLFHINGRLWSPRDVAKGTVDASRVCGEPCLQLVAAFSLWPPSSVRMVRHMKARRLLPLLALIGISSLVLAISVGSTNFSVRTILVALVAPGYGASDHALPSLDTPATGPERAAVPGRDTPAVGSDRAALPDHSTPAGALLVREVILKLRLPRALNAFSTGGLLALAGVLMQVLLRNPLADPYVLGISGGAAVAALAAMLLGLGGLMVD